MGRLMASNLPGITALTDRLKQGNWGFEWWCPAWRTLEQAGGQLEHTLVHTRGVNSVAVMPDGRPRIALTGGEGPPRALVEVHPEEGGRLVLRDAAGEPAFRAP